MLHKIVFLIYIFYSNFYQIKGQANSCSTNPCKNGGTCILQPGIFYGYSCLCNGQWTGYSCDKPVGGQGIITGGSAGGGGNFFPGGNNMGGGSNTGGGGSINIGGGGNNNYPGNNGGGGSINIGGGGNNYPSSGNININTRCGNCLNGGFCKSTMGPCTCQSGTSGPKCEFSSFQSNPCLTQPCLNNGVCRPYGSSYNCQCRNNFSGQRCEKYNAAKKKSFLGYILGTVLPFLFIVSLIGLCVYCCCCRKKGNQNNSGGGLMGRVTGIFNKKSQSANYGAPIQTQDPDEAFRAYPPVAEKAPPAYSMHMPEQRPLNVA